ncbi:MAG: AmmeMemoRadiSam system protein B [Thiohalophilus sp.]
MNAQIRQPAVAGMFYPADAAQLRPMLDEYLEQASAKLSGDEPVPRAIVAPHAGYIYSGPVAASAYARIQPAHARFKRVLLLGPSHRVPFRGIATSSATHFLTPLGLVALDRAAIEQLETLPQVSCLDQAHSQEHSLEVQIPFLQYVLDEFVLVPLVVGETSPHEVDEVINQFWDDQTLIVISSDLSHYHDYATAQQLDRATSNAIEALHPEEIEYGDACGRNPLNGLLHFAREHGLHATTVDLRNSGDTAGPRDQVVGYGAYLIQ